MKRRIAFFSLVRTPVFFFAFAALTLAVASSWAEEKKEKIVVRISHFRPSIPATVQKSLGSLEKKLEPLGATVQWNEFKVTTDSILALSSGVIDIVVGGVEGQTAAIASGVPIEFIATGPHSGTKTGWFTAILVPEDSPIKNLADLKGKKIAVGKGGFSEAILATAVRKGGFKYPDDVQPVFLNTADGNNAFASGLVDAVLTLDPYVPLAQRPGKVRVLTTNEELGYPTIWSVSVQKKFAQEHPEIVRAVAQEFFNIGPWIAGHRTDAATALAKVVGFDQDLWTTTLGRASYVLQAPDEKTLPDVQLVADKLFDLGVIRKPVNVAEHVWHDPALK